VEKEATFVKRSLAEQVAESLRESIRYGRLSENTRLPSSRELARRYGISHNVMLKSLQQLNEEDVISLLSKRRGYIRSSGSDVK
jgi:DNA-binding FadR family transcriptional regulator